VVLVNDVKAEDDYGPIFIMIEILKKVRQIYLKSKKKIIMSLKMGDVKAYLESVVGRQTYFVNDIIDFIFSFSEKKSELHFSGSTATCM
jgi:hypothetical protein